ncbi:recombinase family protein [Brevibacterium otitidis]|uniref:Recombinase family protein n=1 Tax=Brevibacterium otitidis TaxID=53364 RepID=A0ABV5X689_9MICO
MLEAPELSTNLEASIARLREVADDDWTPAIVYGRASQDRKKLMRSINDQLLDCVSWCEPLRWYPDVIVRDSDRSASQWRKKIREGFDEVMALIEEGKHGGFVTWEPFRAMRDLEVYVQLRKACRRANVLYLTHGRVYDFTRSDDSFAMGWEFLRAEADADTMRERQLRTVKLNAERGRPTAASRMGTGGSMTSSSGCCCGRSLTRTRARSSGMRPVTCWRVSRCTRWRCGSRMLGSRPR